MASGGSSGMTAGSFSSCSNSIWISGSNPVWPTSCTYSSCPCSRKASVAALLLLLFFLLLLVALLWLWLLDELLVELDHCHRLHKTCKRFN